MDIQTFDAKDVQSITVTVLVVTAAITLGISTAVAGSGVFQDNNTTTATAGDPADQEATVSEECEPQSDAPQLSQSRLYTPQQVITADESGQIAGGFQVAPDASCPVVVSITMSVPSGMTISGASDIVSSGAGLATAQFTVQPGEIQDIRANVYSSNTGERTVTADIQYWPEGHEEQSRSIDGISLTFDVQEANDPPASQSGTTEQVATGEDNNSAGFLDNTMLVAFGAFALIVLAIVAVATRSDSVNIGIKK